MMYLLLIECWARVIQNEMQIGSGDAVSYIGMQRKFSKRKKITRCSCARTLYYVQYSDTEYVSIRTMVIIL
jgi:hypothetical protein